MSTTSLQTQNASSERRERGIDRLFAHMEGLYGSLWMDRLGGCDVESVKRVWMDALHGMSADQLAHGRAALMRCKLPPTLPEFVSLCQPPIDPEAAYYEAMRNLHLRGDGMDRWTHPAIYWTFASIGQHDMRVSAWTTIKTRWSRLLEAELAKGHWPEVPEMDSAALPHRQTPEEVARAKEAADKARAALQNFGNPNKDPKAWARALRSRYLKGERLHICQIESASEALEETWKGGECQPRRQEYCSTEVPRYLEGDETRSSIPDYQP